MKTFYLNNTRNHHVNEYDNNDGEQISDLISYTTKVASYNHDTNKMNVYGWYSMTTARHINAFFDFCGLTTKSKKEIKTNFLNK